jgi:hypothetical protein
VIDEATRYVRIRFLADPVAGRWVPRTRPVQGDPCVSTSVHATCGGRTNKPNGVECVLDRGSEASLQSCLPNICSRDAPIAIDGLAATQQGLPDRRTGSGQWEAGASSMAWIAPHRWCMVRAPRFAAELIMP